MSDAGRPSLGDVVSAATFVVAIVTGWLYVAGWSYAYAYFDRFSIPLLMVQLPVEHHFIYGGLVVWKNLVAAIAIAVLLLALAWACMRWASVLDRFGISTLLVLVIVASFAMAHAAGIATAQSDFLLQRERDYAAYPRVALALKKEAAATIGDRLGDLLTTDCGRLILVSNDRLFLTRPIRSAPGANLDSFVIPADQVAAVRIVSEHRSCP